MDTCASSSDCAAEPEAWCAEFEGGDDPLCTSKTCVVDSDCPTGATCNDAGNYKECLFSCTPQSDCPDAGYRCDPTGHCQQPFCDSNADCPSGHTCVGYENIQVCEPIGDPAMLLIPPVEQFRTSYLFLIPEAYLEDYVNVVAPSGATVSLDGESIPNASFVGVTADWMVARLKTSDGVHRIQANQPIGVTVYGFDDDVSYGYAAGMNLNDL